MATIFYSMAGEGRGHAVRVLTLVEHLRQRHQLYLFAPGDAYEFLEKTYGNNSMENVRLQRIAGLKFRYTGGKLDLFKSMAFAFSYSFRRLPRLVKHLRHQIDEIKPDLCISDFEPGLPRAARASHLPWMSIDHQHVLLAYDLSSLPFQLRRYAWWMSWAVRWYYGWSHYLPVASSFYSPPLKRGFEKVRQVGPMLRNEILSKTPQTQDFLLSYLRTNTPDSVLASLEEVCRPVRIYGLGERPSRGQLTFHAINDRQFAEDLANCEALFSAAGNQLLGEALYLGKPVFAIPELMHHEQQINAHFLKRMGAGEWTTSESFTADRLRAFLGQLEQYRADIAKFSGKMNGTQDALDAIEQALQNNDYRSAAASDPTMSLSNVRE